MFRTSVAGTVAGIEATAAVSFHSAYRHQQRFENRATISCRHGSGRPLKITEEVKRIVEAQMQFDDETTATQLRRLLAQQGEDAENILSSTNIKAEERKNYNAVVQKFDAFFTVRRNVIFERARFNCHSQLDGESAEQYITTLYGLAENCDCKNWKDEMICDRLVLGIRDLVLSERMQMDPDLTLENAKKMVRQKEAVKEQQQELKCDAGGTQENNIDRVKLQSKEQGKFTQDERSGSKCHRCGKRAHPFEHCPAKDVRCSSCHRMGHFAAHCRTRGLQTMQQKESDSSTAMDSAYLAVVGQESSWMVDIQLCGRNLKFKLDMGAEVTAISEAVYKTLGHVPLQKPTKMLFGPSAERLQTLGEFEGILAHGDTKCKQRVFVVKRLRSNLLGLPAIEGLKLVTRMDNMSDYNSQIMGQFPKLFRGLGNVKELYHIQLKPNSRPHALYTGQECTICITRQGERRA
ncbi:hypothetical protein EMCRGX_G026270 [Ephydatia muelleri]